MLRRSMVRPLAAPPKIGDRVYCLRAAATITISRLSGIVRTGISQGPPRPAKALEFHKRIPYNEEST